MSRNGYTPSRRRNPDTNTTILLAVLGLGGIAAYYYFNKSKTAATPDAAKQVGSETATSAATPGDSPAETPAATATAATATAAEPPAEKLSSATLSYSAVKAAKAGGADGGKGKPKSAKTLKYGPENIKQYQTRLNFLTELLKTNKLSVKKTGIPRFDVCGNFGPSTQSGASGFKRLILKAAKCPKKGAFVTAMAAVGNGKEPDYEMKLFKALIAFDMKKTNNADDVAAFAFALK